MCIRDSRMLSRGATTEIDGALSNPAGLAFLPKDGFHVGSVSYTHL